MEIFKESVNVVFGFFSAILAFMFGEFWWLFSAFFVLNVADYVTGWYKARYQQNESSKRGSHGIAKKVGYWFIIGIGFFISVSFGEIGRLIGVDLGFVALIGYFVLVTYIINEIRSILENLVVCGVKVPEFLIKGLEVTKKMIDDRTKFSDDDDKKD